MFGKRTPNWILKYKRKVTNMRVRGIILLLLGCPLCYGVFNMDGNGLNPLGELFFISLFFGSCVAVFFGFVSLVGPIIKYRKIDDHFICHFATFRDHLVIDDVEQDHALFGKCYGTLPDGREVETGGLFRITFKVTDPQTGRARRL